MGQWVMDGRMHFFRPFFFVGCGHTDCKRINVIGLAYCINRFSQSEHGERRAARGGRQGVSEEVRNVCLQSVL